MRAMIRNPVCEWVVALVLFPRATKRETEEEKKAETVSPSVPPFPLDSNFKLL